MSSRLMKSPSTSSSVLEGAVTAPAAGGQCKHAARPSLLWPFKWINLTASSCLLLTHGASIHVESCKWPPNEGRSTSHSRCGLVVFVVFCFCFFVLKTLQWRVIKFPLLKIQNVFSQSFRKPLSCCYNS